MISGYWHVDVDSWIKAGRCAFSSRISSLRENPNHRPSGHGPARFSIPYGHLSLAVLCQPRSKQNGPNAECATPQRRGAGKRIVHCPLPHCAEQSLEADQPVVTIIQCEGWMDEAPISPVSPQQSHQEHWWEGVRRHLVHVVLLVPYHFLQPGSQSPPHDEGFESCRLCFGLRRGGYPAHIKLQKLLEGLLLSMGRWCFAPPALQRSSRPSLLSCPPSPCSAGRWPRPCSAWW